MVSVDNMGKEVARLIELYAAATEEVLKSATETTADETIKELNRANPPGSGEYGSWDEYNKDWKKNTKKRKGAVNSTVYNKSHYQLTHLLENGHAKVGGGRTRAFPHIKTAEDNAEKRLIDEIEKGIGRI